MSDKLVLLSFAKKKSKIAKNIQDSKNIFNLPKTLKKGHVFVHEENNNYYFFQFNGKKWIEIK